MAAADKVVTPEVQKKTANRRRRRKKKRKLLRDLGRSDGNPTAAGDKESPMSTALTTAPGSEFISKYLREFEHLACLGQGSFGMVFEAKNKMDGKEYAVKRIKTNRGETDDELLKEVRNLSRLNHRYIVRYYGCWWETPPAGWQLQTDKALKGIADFSQVSSQAESSQISGVVEDESEEHSIIFVREAKSPNPSYFYIKMELCSRTLKDWLSDSGRRSDAKRRKRRGLRKFKQIVKAVTYMHKLGIMHRDLKPANIFLSLRGNVKVGDFGLSKEMSIISTGTGKFFETQNHSAYIGTHPYVSPEQWTGKLYNHKVDIYAMGVILFELLCAFSTEAERVKVINDLKLSTLSTDYAGVSETKLAQLLLSEDPARRPEAKEICLNRHWTLIQQGCLSNQQLRNQSHIRTIEQSIRTAEQRVRTTEQRVRTTEQRVRTTEQSVRTIEQSVIFLEFDEIGLREIFGVDF